MKEYISRESALEAITWNVAEINSRAQAESVLRDVPVADVVEVVRCGECEYWRGCWDICSGIGVDFDANGFCCEGKRRSEDA